jgi:hypothetical protein
MAVVQRGTKTQRRSLRTKKPEAGSFYQRKVHVGEADAGS